MPVRIGLTIALAIASLSACVSDGFAQVAPAPPTDRPWMDIRLSPDRRADLIEAQMTLDEKITMVHGHFAVPFPPFSIPPGAIGSAGYVSGNPRLGIPALQETDASLGITNPFNARPGDVSTPLPSGLMLASTFDPALAYAGGRMIAEEARAKGFNVLLAPGANLARDPRNGRNFEYDGEDPLLTGTLAGEAIRGIQSVGMIATLKHFVANDQETHRMTANAVMAEPALRQSDLLAFEIAIERGRPGSVMCAYNLVNARYACENDAMLNGVLKHDWSYPGWVMSDWGAVHGVDAAVHGLDQQSGQELDKAIWFGQPLKDAVAAGTVPQARLDDMVHRILRSMFANGLFDTVLPVSPTIDFEAHARIAQQLAESGIILLENRRSLLPLALAGKRIAVIGGHADAGVASGSGSSQVTSPYTDGKTPVRSVPIGGDGFPGLWFNTVFHPSPPLAAIRRRAGNDNVTFDSGIYPDEAARVAKAADVAIVFAYQPSEEGTDVPNMQLPAGQGAMIAAVAAANPNTIVVLQTGNAVNMPWSDKVAAVMQTWYSGARGGEAIARVITGEIDPSGRLPITWPAGESQLPRPEVPGRGADPAQVVKVDYDIEGSDVGYRWFARTGAAPRYPFGYGLSYTAFMYSNFVIDGGADVTISVDVTNTGSRAGSDVPQIYLLSTPGGRKRRLIGFQKVPLAPGETRRVVLTGDPRLFGNFDARTHRWQLDAGRYELGVGRDATSIALRGVVRLKARTIKP